MRPGPPLLYLATAGGLALTARSVLGHPLSLPLAAGYMAGYLGVVMLGVAVPRLEMWGEVVWRVPEGRGVALTFDDGPHPEHTRQVARLLEKAGARATFFAIGSKAERHPEVLRELCDLGHEVGVHGYAVDRLLGLRRLGAVRDDLSRATSAIEKACGRRPTLFRPPYGILNPRFFVACDELELEVVGWTSRGLDGLPRTSPSQIARRVIPSFRDGAIVCLHDAPEVGERTPAVIAALPELLSALDARNLSAVTVSALLESAEPSG